MADVLEDLLERHEYTQNSLGEIRREAAIDMQYVAGNPWTADDNTQRKNRPTIAPEEMGQYFNQVINQLWANPRGIKFAPRGSGASDAGARFYQHKAREIEYRSHAKVAYITAASDAIQRSYGFVRVNARYASPRTRNQELWIEAVPNPDMVSPDPDAKSPDSADMQYCFVEEWRDQREFTRQFPKAKIVNFGDWASRRGAWIAGQKVLVAEYWTIATHKRKLLLVQPMLPQGAAPQPERMIAPTPMAMPQPMEVFADEIPAGAQVIRELRDVDYPSVKMYLTNGLEILHEQDWAGKYIPIISCYGKILYVPEGGETKRKILSMTRFGRDPWKAMCYADSSIVEVTSGIVKAPFMAAKGQFAGPLGIAVQESMYQPKAFLEYDPNPDGNGAGSALPPPMRPDTPNGQYLQSLLLVSERFRRGIQSAMGSNFLPSLAQKRNEKSGVALEKMDQAATTGTFHFVNNYEDMIRHTGVVLEDLFPHYYDFAGETAIMEDDLKARSQAINVDKPDAIPTEAIKADYLTTVSTGPSSDSEREAVDQFTDALMGNIAVVAQIAGPKAAAAIMAHSVRMKNMGPMGDRLADLIEPEEYKQQDGQEPPDPRVLALQAENQQLKGVLQQAAQEQQAKKVEQQGKAAIVQVQEQAETQRTAMDLRFQKLKLDVESEVKLSVAALSAKVDRVTLLLEQQARLAEHVHDDMEQAKNRVHERQMVERQHAQAMEAADAGVIGQMAVNEAKPQPQAGADA